MKSTLEFDAELLQRLPALGPRYTSYPTADRFQHKWHSADWLAQLDVTADLPLSVYVHIPFCNTICFYCACNKIITKTASKADVYVDYLLRELELYAPHMKGRMLQQLHFGGGTPTFLSDVHFEHIIGALRQTLPFSTDAAGEFSIEIDPRKVGEERVHHLRGLGFNRMSLGVQDIDPIVQKSVNRIQPIADTERVLRAARAAGFHSISMDLIYGLPHQNSARFERTLDQVLAWSPNRLSLYHYAHLPHRFSPQQRIQTTDLPSGPEKLAILHVAIERLSAVGYVYIGMDHFARPDDELAIALGNGSLQRNFQGYSTHANCDLISLGVSAIGHVGAAYAQNVKTLDAYYSALDKGELPLATGCRLTRDDEIRAAVIQELMCRFELDIATLETRWGIVFDTYFSSSLRKINEYASIGLLTREASVLRVLPRGRLLVRNIAMLFDAHLDNTQPVVRYSQTH